MALLLYPATPNRVTYPGLGREACSPLQSAKWMTSGLLPRTPHEYFGGTVCLAQTHYTSHKVDASQKLKHHT